MNQDMMKESNISAKIEINSLEDHIDSGRSSIKREVILLKSLQVFDL